MTPSYKPEGYNSLSPYLIINNAQRMIDLLTGIFDATQLRMYKDESGRILHGELMIDDSVIMLADSTEQFPPNHNTLHVYVPDVQTTFAKAIKLGCEKVSEPIQKEHDPDIRGSFKDFQGNSWSIGTQV